MNNLVEFSLFFFFTITSCSLLVYLVRTSPWTTFQSGASSYNVQLWLAGQIHGRFGVSPEAFLARMARLSALTTKYGVAAWALWTGRALSLNSWVLIWVLLLVIELLRKASQFHMPSRWENTSLKLDSEHFWLIHLILLGTAEVQLHSGEPWGLMCLVLCYLLFGGESRPSILASLEDVASCGWSLVALCFLAGREFSGISEFAMLLFSVVAIRGVVRVVLGRGWLIKRFWWVAQFCLMTSLIVKAMVVLNVLAVFNS